MKPAVNRLFTRRHWVVDNEALPPAERVTFQTMAQLQDTPMEQVTLDSRSGVSTLSLQSVYYVKTFKGSGNWLRYWLGSSRYQRELRNLQYFSQLGLSTPNLIAYGHESRLGLWKNAVLVTLEVRGAADLEQWLRSGKMYCEGVTAARKVLRKLALAVRTLHADSFYHKDLKTRNILLRRNAPAATGATGATGTEPELFFFDCPSGHRSLPFMRWRGRVRDLAHLEEGLRGHLRKVDLLYLFKVYRGCDKLSGEDKALARAALCYYSQRRMTIKRRLRAARKNRQRSDD